MKTRNGFVSNSSSTSFTLMTTEAEHQKILAQLDANLAKAADKLVARKNIGGVDLVMMGVEYGDVQCISTETWDGLDQVPTFEIGNGLGNRAGEVSLNDLVHHYREAVKESGADVVFGSHTR